jgi:glc operon protein GlcG
MHRTTMLAVALGFALLSGTASFAQAPPPDPNNPNEKVPDTMAPLAYGEPIDLETAKKVAAAARAEMGKRNWRGMCIAVVGPSGDLVYFEKDDYCQYSSIDISQHKARAAARFRVPTLAFERRLAMGQFNAYLPSLGDAFIASRGGNPLVSGGKVIGAIGVSGGAGAQDDAISQAGVAGLQ